MAWILSHLGHDSVAGTLATTWPALVAENAGMPSAGHGFLRACVHAAKYENDEIRRWLQEPSRIAVLQHAQHHDCTVHRTMLAHLRCALEEGYPDSLRLRSLLQEEVVRSEYGGALCSSYLRDLLWTFLAAREAKAEDLSHPDFWRRTLPSVERAEVSVLLAVPGANKGYVGTLSLDLVKREEGVTTDCHDLTLYPTPLLSLITRSKSFQHAEQAALQYVRSVIGKDLPKNADIRWDLKLRRGEALPSRLEGPSLGAAVALALLRLLGHRQTRPLEKQLVWVALSAAVDAQGNLHTVGEEFSKLLAAVHALSGVNVVVMAAGQPVKECPDFKPDPVDERLLRRITIADVETPQGAQFCIIKAESLVQAVDLLILYRETRLGPPPPDGDLVSDKVPRAHLATDMPAALRTFDLGMVWGLDRGGFIGLASGAEGDGLYNALLRSERALWDALGRKNTQRPHPLRDQIPVRYWVRVTADRYPNGPRSMQELWNSATRPESDSLQIRYLRQLTEPPRSLGVFLEVDTAKVGHTPVAIQWCRRLLQGVFPTQPIAIVIHLSGGSPNERADLVRVLQAQMRDIAGTAPASVYPIHSTAWVGANPSQQRKDIAVPDDPRARMRQRGAIAQPGTALWTALCCVIAKTDEAEERVGSSARHSLILAASDDLERRLGSPVFIRGEPFPDQRSVVRDIDEFYSAPAPPLAQSIPWSHETDSQFLSAVRDFFPESLPELIREYAAGKRRAGWRQSLLLAVPFDHRMDAWVQGSELAQDRVADDMLLPSKGMGVVNALALGILRAYRAQHRGHTASFTPERAFEVLRQLCHALSMELKSLVEHALRHPALVLPPEDVAQLCEEYGESILLLAFRGGICGELSSIFHKLAPTLNAFDFWYYVAQQTPTRDLVLELLGAPEVFSGVPARAVIGLMGVQEWHAILRRKDRQLIEDLVQSRGGRPLSVFVRNTALSP